MTFFQKIGSFLKSIWSRWNNSQQPIKKKPPFMQPLPILYLPTNAQPQPATILAAPEVASPTTRRERKKRAPKDRRPAEFKRDVLEQLERYHDYVSRMKKADPEAYKFYTKVGSAFTNMNEGDMLSRTNLDPYFLKELPAFGSVAMVQDGYDPDFISGRFAYFRKYETSPFNVQFISHDAAIYSCTWYHDDKKDKILESRKHGVAQTFFVAVHTNGYAQILLQLNNNVQVINHRDHGRSKSFLYHQRWGLPRNLIDWAEDHEDTPIELGTHVFIMLVNLWAAQMMKSMVRIEARKNKIAAILTVDTLEIPTFFKDRNAAVLVNGRRAPIFHIVRAHVRTMPDGTKKGIAPFFSGARQFYWNGHKITITVPGKDHKDHLRSGGLNAHDEETVKMHKHNDNDRYVDAEAMADAIVNSIETSTAQQTQMRKVK